MVVSLWINKKSGNKKKKKGKREEKRAEEKKGGRKERERRIFARRGTGVGGERGRNYAAISVSTIRRKRNYGINGGVRRGVIKNDTWGKGFIIPAGMAAKILHGSLSLLLVIIHGRGKGIREIKAPRYDSRCIVFCNFTVSLSRRKEGREGREAKRRFFLKLIPIRVQYFRSCVYVRRLHTNVLSFFFLSTDERKEGRSEIKRKRERKREREKAGSATSVKSTGVPRKFLSKRLPLRKTLLSHVERKSGCSGRKTNGQVMAFVRKGKGKRASRAAQPRRRRRGRRRLAAIPR